MRLLSSFFLALFLYSAIVGFFIYFLVSAQKNEKPKTVYIHQVIMEKNIKKSKQKPKVKAKKIVKKKAEPKQIKKSTAKETASKNTLSTGGDDIKFDDIFSNVSDNIKTTKIKQKKKQQLTKQKSIAEEIKKQLNQIQTNMSISNSSGKTEDLDYIQNELAKVWNSILTNDGDFIKIKINISNGVLNFVVIATNLDTIRLNQFKTRLNNIDTNKLNNLNAVINFKSKLKENE
jgi:hypothetical protein